MRVHTYFEPVEGLAEPELVELWRESWARHGWEPVVLNESHARRHPRYTWFKRHPAIRRTPNLVEYERACFLRWLAFEVEDAYWVSDYDVMNYGWTPGQAHGLPPCLLSGTPCPAVAGWLELPLVTAGMADLLALDALPEDLPVSDQTAMGSLTHLWEPRHDLKTWGDDVCDGALLVHFPNRTTPRPRTEHIRRFKNPLA